VQFPFRLLAVAEFAAATVMGTASIAALRIALAALAWVLLAWQAALMQPSSNRTMAELAGAFPDVPENLPPGQRPYSSPSRWALELAQEHRAPSLREGIVVEPRFYFPSAEVRCGERVVSAWRDQSTGLLMYRGREPCTVREVMTPSEKLGVLISFLGLLSLFLWFHRKRRESM
jgi:hypothetical protein